MEDADAFAERDGSGTLKQPPSFPGRVLCCNHIILDFEDFQARKTGSLVQIQRGPATVMVSALQMPLGKEAWEGARGDEPKPGDRSSKS